MAVTVRSQVCTSMFCILPMTEPPQIVLGRASLPPHLPTPSLRGAHTPPDVAGTGTPFSRPSLLPALSFRHVILCGPHVSCQHLMS